MAIATHAPAIRDLRRSDVAGLVRLGAVLGGSDSADVWRSRVRDAAIVALVAEQDGRLVGYAAGGIRASFGLATAGWIEAFGVANAWRGRGLGRMLAAELLECFRAKGATHVYTIVPIHDLALQPFFLDLGFREEPVVPLGRSL